MATKQKKQGRFILAVGNGIQSLVDYEGFSRGLALALLKSDRSGVGDDYYTDFYDVAATSSTGKLKQKLDSYPLTDMLSPWEAICPDFWYEDGPVDRNFFKGLSLPQLRELNSWFKKDLATTAKSPERDRAPVMKRIIEMVEKKIKQRAVVAVGGCTRMGFGLTADDNGPGADDNGDGADDNGPGGRFVF